MNYFNLWEKCLDDKINDISFIEGFLKKTDASREVLLNGSDDELFQFSNFLNRYDISKLIETIDSSYLTPIEPNLVTQFSNFDSGIYDVPRVLNEQNRALTFDEVGMFLLGERDPGAMKKYGENHSKLASLLDLVELSNERPIVVALTSFGRFCSMIDDRFKNKVFRALVLRDPLMRNMVYRAKQGKCKYSAEVSCLSESTQVRRRSNVKQLLEYILTNTDYEDLLDNIQW